ncbi:MAG: hypothetical protein ABIP55_07955 [Tepidisphaeraceae bacterium]
MFTRFRTSALTAAAGLALGVVPTAARAAQPLSLLQDSAYESIYAPPAVTTEDQGTNQGGVNIDLVLSYFSDYVFRGIDRSETSETEDAGNIQFDGALRWDLGRYPDLFMGVFTNINEGDSISHFQEIRPYFGIELTARPLILTAGNTFYIYPDRDTSNTAEVWGRLQLDDSYFFRTDDPVFSPYVLCAYDYRQGDGFYLEAGVRHDFQIEDTPLVLSPVARVAYVINHQLFRTGGIPAADPAFGIGTSGPETGFQHYQLGLEATYTLNQLLNIPARLGQLDLKGYLFYTDGIDNDLRADTEIYGGVGIGFSY